MIADLILDSLTEGKSRDFGGHTLSLQRHGDKLEYELDGKVAAPREICKSLGTAKTIAALVEPPTRIIYLKPLSNLTDWSSMRLAASALQLQLYFYDPKQELLYIDWKTFNKEQPLDGECSCIFCDKQFASTKAAAVHIRKYHRSSLEKSEDKKHLPVPDLSCPYCGKIMKSLSGKTNHIKSAHPEKV